MTMQFLDTPAAAKAPAPAPVIRLDRSRTFSECRGERTPEDPQYKVHFWQGGKLGPDTVLLPFDAQGLLIPDDGKTAPWMGLNNEGKPVQYHPLYDAKMRKFLELKSKKMATAATATAEEPELEISEDVAKEGADVNFESWLRGEVRYQAHQLRAAAKSRYSKNYPKISELVTDLVLDEKLVPEDQVCEDLRKHLPKG